MFIYLFIYTYIYIYIYIYINTFKKIFYWIRFISMRMKMQFVNTQEDYVTQVFLKIFTAKQ